MSGSSKRGLWLMLVVAGLCAAGCGRSVTWAPDGSSLAVDVDGKLQLFSLTTRTFHPLDTGERHGFAPAFSPDGRKLAYYGITGSGAVATCDIWVRDLPGTSAADRKVAADVMPAKGVPEDTASSKPALQLAWSPDGKRLAHSRIEGARGHIEVIDLTTGAATPLDHGAQSQFMPAWSPDGSRLAYLGQDTGASGDEADHFAVYVAQPGSADPALKLPPVGKAGFWPAWPLTWTPDGADIVALEANPNGTGSLYALKTDEHAASLLTTIESVQGSLTPDLKRVVFMGGSERREVALKTAPFHERSVLDRIAEAGKQGGPWGKPEAPLHPVIANDGRTVALPILEGKRELRLYDLETGAKSAYPIP